MPPGCANSPTTKRITPIPSVAPASTRRLLRWRLEKPTSGRMAATGGMRPARAAGTKAATRVTPRPTNSDTAMVRAEMTVDADGKAAPVALNSAVMPFETRTPPAIPSAVASRPMMPDSPRIIMRIWRMSAPMARSSASSRRRWLTMIANVLKIRNALTNREIAAKPRRTLPKMSMMSLMAPAVSLAD